MTHSITKIQCACASFALLMCAIFLPLSADAAIARTNIFNGYFNSNAQSEISTSTTAFVPPNNSLLVVVVGNLGGFDTSIGVQVSGGSLTWTRQAISNVSNTGGFYGRSEIWTAPVTRGASMTVDITFPTSSTNWTLVQVAAYTGYGSVNPIGAKGIKDPLAFDGPDSITLDKTAQPTSVVVASAYSIDNGAANNTVTPGTGWTQIYQSPNTDGFGSLATEQFTGSRTNSASWLDVKDNASADFWSNQGLAIEIRAAGTLAKPPNNLGLVGYWSFDEGSGTRAGDFSGNRNTGILGASVGALPQWTSGKNGKALVFSPSEQNWVKTDDINAMDGLTRITVSAWLKSSGINVNASIPVIGKAACTGGSGDGPFEFTIGHNVARKAEFFIYDPTLTSSGSSISDVEDGKWHFVVGMYDGADLTVWVDGVKETTNTIGSVTLTSTAHSFFVSGYCDGNPATYSGTVDEVRVYNRALTPTEIKKLYQSGAVKLGASTVDLQRGSSLENGLVGHWTFDGADITANAILDRSGQGNHGGFYGGATSSAKVIGKLGQALSFNGAAQYVTLASTTATSRNSNFTLSAWVKRANSNCCNGIISKGSQFLDTGQFQFMIHHDANPFSYLELKVGNGASVSPACTSSGFATPAQNEWIHVIVTTDTATIYYYLNGVAIGTCDRSSIGSSFTGDDFFAIGTINADGLYMQGGIDDVHMYNRALSAAEIKQLYNLGQAKVR